MVPIESRLDEVLMECIRQGLLLGATTDLYDRGDSRVSLRVVLNSSSLRCPDCLPLSKF